MSIKFLYHRFINDNGSLSCKGGTTVGYVFNPDNSTVRLAVARCGLNEHFCRRIARDIVSGRILSEKPGRHVVLDLKGITNTAPAAIEDIVWGWLETQEQKWQEKACAPYIINCAEEVCSC